MSVCRGSRRVVHPARLASSACIDETISRLNSSVPRGSFDKDDSQQSKKLDEMDLDDILNRAEHHETVAAHRDSRHFSVAGYGRRV